MANPVCFHTTDLGHGQVHIPADLEYVRKRKKEKQFHCGSCSRTFSAICSLHLHLKGDSYHYDHLSMTAYPLNPTSCQKKPVQYHESEIGSDSEDEENIPTYYTESGAVVGTMTKYRRKRHKYKTVTKSEEKLKAEPIEIENNPDYDEEDLEDSVADPSNVTFEYTSSKVGQTGDSQAKTVVFEKDVFGNLPTDMLTANKLKEESSSVMESDTQTNDITDIAEAVERIVSDLSTELGEEIPESSAEGTALENTTIDDKNDELANDDEQEPLVNMQMTINLHSLETNPDGSLKIVVGEEDAGIFRTAQGEEILKALKEQAAKGVVSKDFQVVYNYTAPASSVASGSQSSKKHEVSSMKKKKRKRRPAKDEIESELDHCEMGEGTAGLEAVVFMTKHDRISTDEAIYILNECNQGEHADKISKIQPLSAKGGELYVVDLEALPDKRDCRHDKYLWVHCGKKSYPKQNPKISKAMYKIKLPNQSYSDGFQKNVFEPVDPAGRYAIVHYTGYESLFQPLPHGNRKYGNKAYQRTCPSVLEELKSLSKTSLTPTMIHQQIQSVAPEPGLRNVRTPRDLRQIRNYVFKEKRLARKHIKAAVKNNSTSP